MNSALKKLALFGLAAGIGGMLVDQSEDKRLKWRASLLARAGKEAIKVCHVNVNKSRVKQVKRKIGDLCKDKEPFDSIELLSFLLAGLDDLQTHCKSTSEIETLIKRTKWLLSFFDPMLTEIELYESASDRYRMWA